MSILQKRTSIAIELALLAIGVYLLHGSRTTRDTQLTALHREILELQAREHRARTEAQAMATALEAAIQGLSQLESEETAAGSGREANLRAWLKQAAVLQHLFADHPEQAIPELSLLTERDWLRLARGAKLVTESEISQTLAAVRTEAKRKFAMNVGAALAKFAASHAGMLPADLPEILPLLDNPVDPAALARYQLRFQGQARETPGNPVVEIAPVDERNDMRMTFGVGRGWSLSPWRSLPFDDALTAANAAYMRANGNGRATDPSSLIPYFESAVMGEIVQAVSDFARSNHGQTSNRPEDLDPLLKTPQARALVQRMWGD